MKPLRYAANKAVSGVRNVGNKLNPIDKPINQNDTVDTGVESLRLGYRTAKKGKKAVRGAKLLYKAPVTTVKVAKVSVKVTETIVAHIAAFLLSPVFWLLVFILLFITTMIIPLVIILAGGGVAGTTKAKAYGTAAGSNQFITTAFVDAENFYNIASDNKRNEFNSLIDSLYFNTNDEKNLILDEDTLKSNQQFKEFFNDNKPQVVYDMGKGGIVGVELDPVTAKIAKHLNVPKPNPYAKKDEAVAEETRDIKILNCGFERSNLENNSFDAVIGNVPFGDYKLNDPDYTNDWLIHDAFFRKALDKVAPGGVVAFITSSGTLDKKNPKVREQLSLNADLIGAVRLPNNAFADADTKVTSDIIFLQKRKTPRNVYDPKPDWCYTSPVEVEMVGKKYEGEQRTAYINSYFAQNPQMVLGTIKQTTHFDMLTCEPNEERTLQEQLETAFRQLNAKISIDKRERSNLEKQGYVEPWGKSFTYQVKDDKVYYNLGNAMEEVEGNDKKIAKLKSLCELRDIVRELLNKQQTYVNDEELTPLRNKLNTAYDNGRNNGLSKGVSMRSALDEQGFKGSSKMNNRLVAWEAAERKAMEDILISHGFARQDKNAHHKHMTVEEYKWYENERSIQSKLKQERTVLSSDMSKENVLNLKQKLSSANRKISDLEKEKTSPVKSFFYSDPDKQSFIQSKMDSMNIPYVETEHGFDAQECYVEQIRQWEKDYKSSTKSFRERIIEDIDRLLVQCTDVEELYKKLKAEGYDIKLGKYISVRPPKAERFIRLKSLGEEYNERALQNRIQHCMNFENKLTENIDKAKAENSPTYKTLTTIRFYTVTFKKGLLPCRKKFKQQPFSWTNDAELDKLLILNRKINQGATIQSMKLEFENLEQKLKEKNESAVEVQKKVQRLSRGQEAFEVLYEGKKSDTISLEEAQLYQKRYPNINANTYHQTKELADSARQEQAVLKNEINELEKEIRELSSAISVAEQVRAGTYVQELVSSENIRRNADVLPNGVFKI